MFQWVARLIQQLVADTPASQSKLEYAYLHVVLANERLTHISLAHGFNYCVSNNGIRKKGSLPLDDPLSGSLSGTASYMQHDMIAALSLPSFA